MGCSCKLPWCSILAGLCMNAYLCDAAASRGHLGITGPLRRGHASCRRFLVLSLMLMHNPNPNTNPNTQASGEADGRSLAALLAARRFAAPEVVSGYQDFSPPDPATTPVGLPVEKDRAKLQACLRLLYGVWG